MKNVIKNILKTNQANTSALVARLALGIVLFPHGAQKLLGWFGGYGYDGTMSFLTGTMALPYFIGLLVILIEFFGAILLFAGFATRLVAIGVILNFAGVIVTSHLNNGFFMNWSMLAGKGEGLEFFILLLGLAIVVLITGGGRFSGDSLIANKIKKD